MKATVYAFVAALGLVDAARIGRKDMEKAAEGAHDFLDRIINKHHDGFPPADMGGHKKDRSLQDFVSNPLLADSFRGTPGFYHGVASGDPLDDGIVLWTRYTPQTETDVVTVEFRVAKVSTMHLLLSKVSIGSTEKRCLNLVALHFYTGQRWQRG